MPSSEEHDSAALYSDYVAECEEHLSLAGRVLLDLEAAPERTGKRRVAAEEPVTSRILKKAEAVPDGDDDEDGWQQRMTARSKRFTERL